MQKAIWNGKFQIPSVLLGLFHECNYANSPLVSDRNKLKQ